MNHDRLTFLFGPDVDADDLGDEGIRLDRFHEADRADPGWRRRPEDGYGTSLDDLENEDLYDEFGGDWMEAFGGASDDGRDTFDDGLGDDRTGQLLAAARDAVANQIYDDDPPEAWEAVQRMQARGFDRSSILQIMGARFLHHLVAGLQGDAPDPADYVDSLRRLPPPTASQLADALVEAARSYPGATIDEIEAAAAGALHQDAEDLLMERLFDHVEHDLLDPVDGELVLLSGDRVFHRPSLCQGLVLTIELNESTRELDYFPVSFDLAGFAGIDDLHTPTGDAIETFSVEPGHLGWRGPTGWLAGFAVGDLLAVRVDVDGAVHLETVPEPPSVDPALVARLRAVYDAEVAESGLPVTGDELVLGILAEDRDAFAAPRPPLSRLAAAAGLEQRTNLAAHDLATWYQGVLVQRQYRVLRQLRLDHGGYGALAAIAAVDVALGAPPAGLDDRTPTSADDPRWREVFHSLDDLGVLAVVLDELGEHRNGSWLGEDAYDADGEPRWPAAGLGVFRAAARRDRERAVAALLEAIEREMADDLLPAEALLGEAHRHDPHHPVVIDRLAWYASDRGDAARAARLWRSLGPSSPTVAADLREVERAAGGGGAETIGRNQPCWCGSGRKYKQCHLGKTELPPLPDRIGWLSRKLVGYLDRGGPEVREDLLDLVAARAVDPSDPRSLREAMDDPLVTDLTLVECGWMHRFLHARGVLLPDDEVLLLEAWGLVERSAHEVVAVDPGASVTLRDLRTGDEVVVRERTYSRRARQGTVICTRVVPDGVGHQIAGGLFEVSPWQVASLLELLDERDPFEIATWMRDRHRPPALTTREGEPLVVCEATVDVPHPLTAALLLDTHFERTSMNEELDGGADDDPDLAPDPDGFDLEASWIDTIELAPDDEIVRAHLELSGDRLYVMTQSEARMDRVLDWVLTAIGGAGVVEDRREPFHDLALRRLTDEALERGDDPAGGVDETNDTSELRALLATIREQHEERWCDEQIPALGGLTPREAVADPTRREEVERLIASFERSGAPDNGVTQRPARLRELLGLEDPQPDR